MVIAAAPISVTERLPPRMVSFLGWHEDRAEWLMWIITQKGEWGCLSSAEWETPALWLPLPPAPTK